MSAFHNTFGFEAEAEAEAPGRVNLLGEHTDYSGGFVLPTVIPQTTRVELARSRDGLDHLHSDNLHEDTSYRPGDDLPPGFARYVGGCVALARRDHAGVAPVALSVSTSIPIGAGLSSSAALEVAVLRGLRALFDLNLDDEDIARLAQEAEISYAGVRCGIMDQMASSLGQPGYMLFLDTRSLDRRMIPMWPDAELIVLDSGLPRTLAASQYNVRRRECEKAASLLGVAALRDVDDPAATQLPAPLDRRARHVISENQRVLHAVAGLTPQRFGELMNESHASLRDDYQVSVPALDLLVHLLAAQNDVFGAKLTGAGFGGACVALASAGSGDHVKQRVLAEYACHGHRGAVLV